MAEAPYEPERARAARRVVVVVVARDERCHRGQVVRVGRVAKAEQDRDDRDDRERLAGAERGDAVVEPEHQPACPIPFAVSRTPATMMTSAEIAGSAVARPPPKFSRVSTLRA